LIGGGAGFFAGIEERLTGLSRRTNRGLLLGFHRLRFLLGLSLSQPNPHRSRLSSSSRRLIVLLFQGSGGGLIPGEFVAAVVVFLVKGLLCLDGRLTNTQHLFGGLGIPSSGAILRLLDGGGLGDAGVGLRRLAGHQFINVLGFRADQVKVVSLLRGDHIGGHRADRGGQLPGAAQAKLADNDALVRSSDNYAQYNAQVQQLSRESGNAYANINALTEAQFLQVKIAQTGGPANEQHAAAVRQAATASDEAAAAAAASGEALAKELADKQANTLETQTLTQAQTDLAGLGVAVAGGLQTAGGAALILAGKYNIAYAEALKLINAQAALAGGSGAARLAGQKAQTRDLATPGAGAVGRKGAGDDAIAGVVAQQQAIKDTAEAQRKYNEAVGGSGVVLANLRKDLESWRGRAFTADELTRFDLQSILGKPCMLNVVQNDKGRAVVSSIATIPKGMSAPDCINAPFAFWIDEWDEAVFEAIPEGLKKIIAASDEFKSRGKPQKQEEAEADIVF